MLAQWCSLRGPDEEDNGLRLSFGSAGSDIFLYKDLIMFYLHSHDLLCDLRGNVIKKNNIISIRSLVDIAYIRGQTIISPYPIRTNQMHKSLIWDILPTLNSLSQQTLDRKIWRKRTGTCRWRFITLTPSPKQAKMNRNRLTVFPQGLLWTVVFSSNTQLRAAIVQQTKQELQQTQSNNRIYSFESKTELLKTANYF